MYASLILRSTCYYVIRYVVYHVTFIFYCVTVLQEVEIISTCYYVISYVICHVTFIFYCVTVLQGA